MLANYPGTVLVVSHDRDFLDRVATSVLMAEGDGHFIEYAGGYSDMLAQRGHGFESVGVPAAKAKKPSAAKEKPKAEAPLQARKLSFHEKHALETLPARMTELEKEIASLHAKLADSAFYARDPKGFAQATSRLEAAQTALAAAEERWLELEALREELERRS
jgi:ATP-binding cassette subfamily F protein uup